MRFWSKILPVLVLATVFAANTMIVKAEDYGGDGASVESSGSAVESSLAEDQTVFDSFKQAMLEAIRQHESLAAENAQLQTEISELQLLIDQKEEELGITVEDRAPQVPAEKPVFEDRELSESSLLLGQNARTPIEEAQELYLSGHRLNIDAGQRLKELYLYDLQFQKQELELDLKLKEFWYRNATRERQSRLDALSSEIYKIKEREQALSQSIMEQEATAVNLPKQVELLKVENQMLRGQMR